MAKKKGRKRRQAPAGVDPNERRRERLEARRQQKAEALAAKQRAERRQRFIRNIFILGLAALAVWFFFFRGGLPSEIDGHPIRAISQVGSGEHTEDPVQYESTPPVAGAHRSGVLPCGVYNSQVENEIQVHMLEHGAVGIQFDPTLDPETIGRIEALAAENDKDVFSGPYPGMETPITLTAWGYLMRLEEWDEPAAREFVDVFAGGGDAPEAGTQDCPNETDEPFEPEAAASPGDESPVPQATITVDPSPTD